MTAPDSQRVPVGERLHPQDGDPVLHQLGNHPTLEAAEVPVERVDRHLDGVEADPVRARHLEHVQVDVGALVAGEPDEADLAGLARGVHRLPGAAGGEDALAGHRGE